MTRQQNEQQVAGLRPQFPSIEIGDQVWLDARNIKTKRPSKKLDHKKLDPFPVTEKVSTHAYRLGLPHAMNQIHNVFHVRLLEPVHTDPFPHRTQPPPPPIKINGELKYEIAEIVDSKIDRRRHGNSLIYRVRWTSYEH